MSCVLVLFWTRETCWNMSNTNILRRAHNLFGFSKMGGWSLYGTENGVGVRRGHAVSDGRRLAQLARPSDFEARAEKRLLELKKEILNQWPRWPKNPRRIRPCRKKTAPVPPGNILDLRRSATQPPSLLRKEPAGEYIWGWSTPMAFSSITEVSVPQLLWKQPLCKRQHLKALLSALERLVCIFCCCDAKPSIRRNPFFGCTTFWHLRCWPVRLQCVLRICQCWMQSYTTWRI